jgi:hypothetical protein
MQKCKASLATTQGARFIGSTYQNCLTNVESLKPTDSVVERQRFACKLIRGVKQQCELMPLRETICQGSRVD